MTYSVRLSDEMVERIRGVCSQGPMSETVRVLLEEKMTQIETVDAARWRYTKAELDARHPSCIAALNAQRGRMCLAGVWG